MAAGVVGVCLTGAAAGLYLKPDLDAPRREAPRSAPAAQPSSDRLAEAEALQTELGVAVAEGGLYPAVVTGPAGGPLTDSAPSPPDEPPPAPPMSIGERAAAVYRAIVPASAPPPRPAPPVRPEPQARIFRPAPPTATPPPPPRAVEPSFGAPVRTAASPQPRFLPPPPRREIPPEAFTPPPPVIAPSPPPRGPSFDCRTVRSAAEDMVCGDPRLADLDRQMATELVGAMAAGHNPDLLLRDQNDWLARRDRAAPDPRAVADAYQRRIGQLRSMQ